MRDVLTLPAATDRLLELLVEADEKIAFEAGVAYRYRNVKGNVVFSADYLGIGTEYLRKALSELHGWICVEGEPKPWVTDLLAGNNQREAAVAILGAVAAKLEVSLSIAVPVAAMLLKKGIHSFCRLGKSP